VDDRELRDLILEAIESERRHPDPRYHADLTVIADNLRKINRHYDPVDQYTEEEIQLALDAAIAGGDNATGGAWRLACDIAKIYLEDVRRPELVEVIDRCSLALSRADRWTTSCAPAGANFVIALDAGLLGALARTARYLGIYWIWDPKTPERVTPQSRFPGPHIMERVFRIYFREFRWNGYFRFSHQVNEPRSSRDLVASVTVLATTYALLHELAHAIRTVDHSLGKISHDEEKNCDTLAAAMIAGLAKGGLDGNEWRFPPGLIALGVRHFFQVIRIVEGSVFMIRPSTHPSASERHDSALKVLHSFLGPDGSITWSRVVHRPVTTLIDLALLPPAWVDTRRTLESVFAASYPLFVPNDESLQTGLLFNERVERFDSFAYLPPDELATMLGVLLRANSPEGRLSNDALSTLGWQWVDENVGVSSAALKARSRTTSQGLLFSDHYWNEEFRSLGFAGAVAAWCLCQTRLGWLSYWRMGIRGWGALPDGSSPRALQDLEWVIREG
jgi:hypothetical protein